MNQNGAQSNRMTNSNATWNSQDYAMMALALRLAKQGQYTARPNPMVGCVITQNDKIVGQGWHQKSGCAHAEVNALHQAGKQANKATCYVTLEPCAHTGKTGPCAKALVNAGVSRVVAAMQDPNPQVAGSGFDILRSAGIQVELGLMKPQAESLNLGFISRFTQGRPRVSLKLAMSIDGRTALKSGASQWITGQEARRDVQKLRAKQDAIITGIGTVLMDDPSLNVRMEEPALGSQWLVEAQQLGFQQPARVLLDRHAKAPQDAKFFQLEGSKIWVTQKNIEVKPEQGDLTNMVLTEHANEFDLTELLEELAKRGMNQVLVEAGSRLAGSFFKQNLVDELIVYMAPKLMGSDAMGLINLQVSDMAQTPLLELQSLTQLGQDIRLNYGVKK
ncbi:bifunctional diaminohydroxyphosphoribosylaminopyrimidine deaminase/5-amino-6-(5-phosphoribosylamino)uracil reductase RibD [Aliikangiella sp. IMCC44653]